MRAGGHGRRRRGDRPRAGLEGVVAKLKDRPYEPGRRSSSWIKKPFRDARTWSSVAGSRAGTAEPGSSARCSSGCTTSRARCATPDRSAAASPTGRSRICSAAGGARRRAQPPFADLSRLTPREIERRRVGYVRNWWLWWSFGSGPATAGCAHPRSKACVPTSHRRRSFVTPSQTRRCRSMSRAAASCCPTSTRCSIPTPASPRAQVLDYYTPHRPVPAPPPRRPAADPQALPERRRRRVLLRKERAARACPSGCARRGLPSPGSTKDRDVIDFMIVDELATLVYVANLASLELHTPMWRVGPKGAAKPPDMLVIDLDPGPPATIVECCRVAELVREESDREWYPKTSGSKGMQLYAGDGERPADPAESTVRRDPQARRAARTQASRPRRQPDDQDAAARARSSSTGRRTTRPRPRSASTRCAPARGRRSARRSAGTRWPGAPGRAARLRGSDVLERTAADGDLFAPVLG